MARLIIQMIKVHWVHLQISARKLLSIRSSMQVCLALAMPMAAWLKLQRNQSHIWIWEARIQQLIIWVGWSLRAWLPNTISLVTMVWINTLMRQEANVYAINYSSTVVAWLLHRTLIRVRLSAIAATVARLRGCSNNRLRLDQIQLRSHLKVSFLKQPSISWRLISSFIVLSFQLGRDYRPLLPCKVPTKSHQMEAKVTTNNNNSSTSSCKTCNNHSQSKARMCLRSWAYKAKFSQISQKMLSRAYICHRMEWFRIWVLQQAVIPLTCRSWLN